MDQDRIEEIGYDSETDHQLDLKAAEEHTHKFKLQLATMPDGSVEPYGRCDCGKSEI